MEVLSRLMILLWYAYVGCLGTLIFRLFWLGVVRRYPAFVAYLTADFIGNAVGLITGRASHVYWWSYFLLSSVLGSALIILMSREMFAEIYYFHPGLRGMTKSTLYRSTFSGIVITLLLAPVALVHWGEPGFTCWELPVIEIQRALKFGQVLFILLMWSRLRWLPLQIPRNVRVYSWLVGIYSLFCGGLSTIVLITHTGSASLVCCNVLLSVSIGFCVATYVGFEKPGPILDPFQFCPLPDPEIIARLTTVEGLIADIEEAATRARQRAIRRARLAVGARLRRATRVIPAVEPLLNAISKLRGESIPEGPKQFNADNHNTRA